MQVEECDMVLVWTNSRKKDLFFAFSFRSKHVPVSVSCIASYMMCSLHTENWPFILHSHVFLYAYTAKFCISGHIYRGPPQNSVLRHKDISLSFTSCSSWQKFCRGFSHHKSVWIPCHLYLGYIRSILKPSLTKHSSLLWYYAVLFGKWFLTYQSIILPSP
jgi:hypothetical protein